MYKQWKDRRKRKKFELDNAITAFGSPRNFYRKTNEQIEVEKHAIHLPARTGGYWIRSE